LVHSILPEEDIIGVKSNDLYFLDYHNCFILSCIS